MKQAVLGRNPIGDVKELINSIEHHEMGREEAELRGGGGGGGGKGRVQSALPQPRRFHDPRIALRKRLAATVEEPAAQLRCAACGDDVGPFYLNGVLSYCLHSCHGKGMAMDCIASARAGASVSSATIVGIGTPTVWQPHLPAGGNGCTASASDGDGARASGDGDGVGCWACGDGAGCGIGIAKLPAAARKRPAAAPAADEDVTGKD